MSPQEGVTLARQEGLDLVEISPSAKPPVCRILDVGKYYYTLEKEEKLARKKHHVIHIKEIKMSSKIREHDYQTKLRNAVKFLNRGDKVKLTMFFRGREITHVNLGQQILDRLIQDLSDVAMVEKNLGLEGTSIVMVFTPKPSSTKKKEKSTKSGAQPVRQAGAAGGKEASATNNAKTQNEQSNQ